MAESLARCIRCGLCLRSCPVHLDKGTRGEISSPRGRAVVSEALLRGELPPTPRAQQELYACSLCEACSRRCPCGLEVGELVLEGRRRLVEEGRLPPSVAQALRQAQRCGSPWGSGSRDGWREGLRLPRRGEWLYFVGCLPALEPRLWGVPRSLVRCFSRGGLSFFVMGADEPCCGGEVYALGERMLFELLRERAVEALRGVSRLVVTSPHCLDAFRRLYGREWEVRHYVELLDGLVSGGALRPGQLPLRVVFHDPCVLGRRHGLYEEPRRVLRAIPGLRLLEFSRNRERSLCCEGGGGRMWFEAPGERRLAEVRVAEAVELGAQVIATACPFCHLVLEDAARRLEAELEVLDVAELLARSLR